MAMAITMRMVARFFFFATEVTQRPLSSVHSTHIKRPPKSRCAICSGFEDTAKMSPRSRGTCPADLAGDHRIYKYLATYYVAYLEVFFVQDRYRVSSNV